MSLIKVKGRGAENLGRRNLLYNGAMQVAQRGTSFAETTAASYTLDRWLRAVGSSFNFDTTITQSTDVPSGEGFKYSLKVECDTVVTPSGSDNAGIGQRLEGHDFQHLCYGTSSAKSIVLTFWTKSNKTGTYCVQFATNHGNSDSANRYSFVREYTINTANTWEKKTLTVPGLTTQDIETTNTEGYRVKWWLAVGGDDTTTADAWQQSASYLATSNQVNFMDNVNNEWYLTGCQLEVADTASPFEHRSYNDELTLCQRYFQLHENIQMAAYVNAAYRRAESYFALPAEMRANPSVNTLTTGNSSNIRSPATTYAGIQMAVSKGGANVHMESNGSGYMYINGRKQSLDAEL